MRIAWLTVGILTASGLVMGVLSLFGLYGSVVEFTLWTLLGALLWTPLLVRADAPLATGALGGLGSGAAAGGVQAAFLSLYLANHPDVAGPASAALALQFLAFTLVVGLVWGLLFGAIAMGVRRWRASPRTASA